MKDRYFCIATSVVGGDQSPFEFVHYVHPKPHASVKGAWLYGLRNLERDDDFNIGVLRDGHWVATLWGPDGEVVDDEPEVLVGIPLP